MYYTKTNCLDCGLGQLYPEGLDCAEVIRIYKQQKKNFQTRSGDHKKRAKANMERFQKAYDQCQGEPAHRIVEAAGGMSPLVSSLTAEDVEQIVSGGASETGTLDYARLAGIVVGGVLLLGGVIWLMRPRGGP